ncbi:MULTISPECIES: SDR family oxidoreductase [unclassified Bradyrhizobium]|uniref:SDR family oxidoreductase n=1 Tax=unclassified Bradyrhizobium TaxID=2631580 RepID=UPI0024783BD8|nr:MULTISPECIES: SDR family oxidoreductase [unclassified Bradyrhizobium]WGR68399.1 SDR family oxidoreductase [Bradyrhizobium sp. ISRA426]WGR80454.1 SDR family oxidoreductase [Bradyrhizobium sp. ISRA430]WGR83639.1 SDR family oxidoreductase [Bradyrhizobium sp. ISRA432]
MRVFLTGATGFIGSHIVPELIGAGHQVLGLTRSDAGARWLEEAGAEAHCGTIEDPDRVARGAAQADAVIHTAFDHDFSRYAENCEKDRRVIEAMGGVLAGSDRPLIITSVIGMGSTGLGEPAIEQTVDWHHANPRAASEQAGAEMAAKGVSVLVIRLPQVHDTAKQGLITPLIEVARAKGVSAYVGDGANRWPAAHVSDVARLYRLALEQHEAGARYHAVAQEGVPMREIAEVVGAGLGVPVVSLSQEAAADHFGWLAMFARLDMPASSTWTRGRLRWQPAGPSLVADLRECAYRPAAAE